MRAEAEQDVGQNLATLYRSELQFRRLLETLPVAAYTCNAEGLITYFNQHVAQAWGREPELNDPLYRFCGSLRLFSADDGSPIPHDQCWMALALRDEKGYNGEEIIVERPDGRRLNVLTHANPIFDESGKLLGAVNIVVDITERKQAEALLAGQKRVLEMLATGAALTDVLAALIRLIEKQSEGILGSILIRRPGGNHFHLGVAPSLPEHYLGALSNAPISPPYLGPCGRSTHLGEEVITSDVATDERWAEQWRDLVLGCELRACYSAPIRASDGSVLGSFAVYHREPCDAKPRNRQLLETATHLAGIAIERKQAEEALRQANEHARWQASRYDALLNSVSDLVYIFDLNHRFTYANQAVLSMWGKSWDEAVGRNCLELGYEPWHAAMHDREIEQVIATRQPVKGEVPFTGTNGRRIYEYIFVPIFGAGGAVEAVGGTSRDVTARKQAEEALREAHLLSEMALSAGGVVAWVWDIAKNRMTGSATFAHLFSVDPEKTAEGLPLETFVEAIHEDDRAWVLEEVARAVESGEPYAADYRVRNADGQIRWVAVRGHIEYDTAGNPLRFPGVLVDITERKQAEELRRKQELEQALEKQMSDERQRVGRELHDGFRQQLLGISMLSATLHKKLEARGAPEAELMQEFSKLLGDANSQLRGLIHNLTPVKVDAGGLVPSLQRACSYIEQWYGVPCFVHDHREDGHMSDEAANHLFHIAQEAMINAAKHSGTPQVEVFLRTQRGRFVLEVRDEGDGLPADYDKKGSMGLTGMRHRAELVGAELTFYGLEPGGTAVSCTLPLTG